MKSIIIISVLFTALLASGCSEVRSRVAADDRNTSFFVEYRMSKGPFGGSVTHVVEINVDNAKLAEYRPLPVGEFNYIKANNAEDDLAKLEGFLWYFAGDGKVLIGIGHKSAQAGDKTITPFIVGEFQIENHRR